MLLINIVKSLKKNVFLCRRN